MAQFICTQCGYEGRRKVIKKGSTTVEILLWITFLIPGPFYSLWRIFSKERVCPMCEVSTMVPLNSALGQRKLAMLEAELDGHSNSSTTVNTTPPTPSPSKIEEASSPAVKNETTKQSTQKPFQEEKRQSGTPPPADEW